MPGALSQFDALLRRSLPFGSCFLLQIIAFCLPRLLPGLTDIAPLLSLTAIYFWAAHRPNLLPLPLLFLLGLIADAVLRLPFGVTALTNVLAAQLVQNFRPLLAGQSYLSLWLGFVAVATIVQLLQWLLLSFMGGQLLPLRAALFQLLVCLTVFPFCAWLLSWADRCVGQASWRTR